MIVLRFGGGGCALIAAMNPAFPPCSVLQVFTLLFGLLPDVCPDQYLAYGRSPFTVGSPASLRTFSHIGGMPKRFCCLPARF